MQTSAELSDMSRFSKLQILAEFPYERLWSSSAGLFNISVSPHTQSPQLYQSLVSTAARLIFHFKEDLVARAGDTALLCHCGHCRVSLSKVTHQAANMGMLIPKKNPKNPET